MNPCELLTNKHICVWELKDFFMRTLLKDIRLTFGQLYVYMILLSLSLISVGSEKLHNYIYRKDDKSLMVHKLFRTLLMSLESQFKVLARMPLWAAVSKRGWRPQRIVTYEEPNPAAPSWWAVYTVVTTLFHLLQSH